VAGLAIEADFASDAEAYARARPTYPPELLEWLSSKCPRREMAWDCATGTGQAALGLAEYFSHVEATDLSPELIAAATQHPRVEYTVCPAEESPFRDRMFDAIVVAQSLHWFDLTRFWDEVRRVARPGALFCAWGYAWFASPKHIQSALVAPIRTAIEPYWPPQNRLLWRGYRAADVGFPFVPIASPTFEIRTQWSPSEILAYMATWSSFRRARRVPSAARLIEQVVERERDLLSSPARVPIRMTLKLLAGFVEVS